MLKLTLTFILLLVSTGARAEGGAGFAWPNGARAAVNLAYDDALASQLDNAIPALDRHGFRGTFYLTLSADTVRLRLDEWRAAAASGHELSNHALFHPCAASKPGRYWVKPHRDLDTFSVEEMRERVLLANTMLHAIDGRTERTFTPPCGDLEAGGENYIESVAPEFVAIKSVFGSGVTMDMESLEPYAVNVTAPAEVSGEELIAVVERAARRGTMANFTFHGIGGDYLSISVEAHEQLLQHLADNPDTYWVDTFLNIMKHVEAERAGPAGK